MNNAETTAQQAAQRAITCGHTPFPAAVCEDCQAKRQRYAAGFISGRQQAHAAGH